MKAEQPEELIKENEKGEAICTECGELLEGIWENNGYQPPDPTHWEIVGYYKCECLRGGDYDE